MVCNDLPEGSFGVNSSVGLRRPCAFLFCLLLLRAHLLCGLRLRSVSLAESHGGCSEHEGQQQENDSRGEVDQSAKRSRGASR